MFAVAVPCEVCRNASLKFLIQVKLSNAFEGNAAIIKKSLDANYLPG